MWTLFGRFKTQKTSNEPPCPKFSGVPLPTLGSNLNRLALVTISSGILSTIICVDLGLGCTDTFSIFFSLKSIHFGLRIQIMRFHDCIYPLREDRG